MGKTHDAYARDNETACAKGLDTLAAKSLLASSRHAYSSSRCALPANRAG